MKELYTNYINGYPEIRNFIEPSRGKIKWLRAKDLFQLLHNIRFKITGKGYSQFYKGLFYNPFLAKNKELRFFNTVYIGSNIWEVTYEDILPRLGKTHPGFWHRLAVKQLARPNYIKITAISAFCHNKQQEYLKKYFPGHYDAIKSKMAIKHPFQKPLIQNYEEKQLPFGKMVFTLTGGDFFRKGGMEILQAFESLLPQHPQLHLNIISSLEFGDYITHTTIEDQAKALQLIQNYPQQITHHTRLPNKQVLEVYKQSHVGLLPTYDDTYGYSVLEAQAAGCPVITTDIRALPEVNNDEIGWVIPLNGAGYNAETSEKLVTQLVITIEEIIRLGGSVIKRKGEKALEHIKQNHSY